MIYNNFVSKVFAAIDLKSFYASVECQERGLDPLTTNLVVADPTRTDKTICLAISPSLKAYGLPGRARLFEVRRKVREINAERLRAAPLGVFLNTSTDAEELAQNPNLALDFVIAPPRMRYYLDYSSKIYRTYLQYVAPEDIFSYSIDEIFCDLSSYLKMQNSTPEQYASKMISAIYQETGITATGGIGSNLYLAKVAMDILAKHAKPNSANVRIAQLDEMSYRRQLWVHTPITDFWRVGRGYAKRLAARNIFTMGDVARCSLEQEELLYQLFGVNAELLIDHAWGYEPVEIADIKNHRPATKSLSSGQVLSCPYDFAKAEVIVREMADSLALELVAKQLVTDHLMLYIDYDCSGAKSSPQELATDHYGRKVPKPARGTHRLATPTSSSRLIIAGFLEIFHRQVRPELTIRKVTLSVNDLIDETVLDRMEAAPVQADLFTDYRQLERATIEQRKELSREKNVQKAVLKIRERYGKNAILRGTNFEDGATGRSRHQQIGGHRA